MKITIYVEGASPEQIRKYEEIFRALLQVGGLDGMKNGSTILHFDSGGVFQEIEFSYRPWRRRSLSS